MTEIICTLITALAGIVVAILSVQIRSNNAKIERQNQIQEEQMLLLMQMVDSAIALSIVNANAVMEYKNNGNVEEAYALAREAKGKYKEFMQKITAHEVSK